MLNVASVFVCGGAVRDVLLGKIPKDIDYVVVGATYEDMIINGFKPIEATSFPVFLDQDGQEWALARTERKTGKGYHGFETNSDSSVTLEDDLFRRDLTINSLAVKREDWEEFQETKNPALVIDPYDGLKDLNDRVLRHVSPAFADDPVRVLRISRFFARYFAEYQFTIARETQKFITQMAEAGEFDHLVSERIWAETEKALMEDTPMAFFHTLNCGGKALQNSLPEFFRRAIADNGAMPLTSAGLRRLDLVNRLMLLTHAMDYNTLEENMRAIKVPNDLIKPCLRFNKLVTMLKNINKPSNGITSDDVWKILDDLNVWSWVDEMRDMGVAIGMIFDANVNQMFDILVTAVLYANTACFDMLTDEQKQTLEGKAIGDAISDLRRQMLR